MTKTDLLICNVLVKEGNFCNGPSVVSNILAYSARHTYVTNYTKVEKKPAKTNSFRYMLLITCDYVRRILFSCESRRYVLRNAERNNI